MDPVVNAQVQSPLVRVLASIPSKSQSFTHGIQDNVPPVSFDIVPTGPKSGVDTVAAPLNGKKSQFEISQFGYLNRLVLNFDVTYGASTNNASFPHYYAATEAIDTVTLSTHNKTIETIYGDSLRYLQRNLPYNKSILARQGSYGFNVATGVSANGQPTNGSTLRYSVELLLSSVVCPALNYQTRFVEDLTLTVQWKDNIKYAITNGPNATLSNVKLLCCYHNFHQNIENSIRNDNYKRGTPASLLTYDHYYDGSFTLTSNIIAEPLSAGGPISGTYSITSNNCAKALLVQISRSADYYLPLGRYDVSVSLSGSGRELYKVDDLMTHSTALQGRYSLVTHDPYTSCDNLTSWIANEDYSTFVIPFGFSSNPLFNSGTLPLQTISNPTLKLTIPSQISGQAAVVYTVKVYVIMHSMVRIDSDTGVITRTLDV